jgi:phage-related protein
MAIFPLPVKAEMSHQLAIPVKQVQFRTGSRQSDSVGVGRPIETWSVEIAFSQQADRNILSTFLLDYRQDKVFQWQSPTDTVPQDYRLDGSASFQKRNGGGSKPLFYTAQLTFKRAYGAN